VFKWKITYREVDQHLTRVVDELLLKHGSVTNPAFEAELESITGIGWKQVKNYKNHPRPAQTVAENSKVKKFIYHSRKSYRLQQTKRLLPASVAIVLLISFGVNQTLKMENDSREIQQLNHGKAIQDVIPTWARFRITELNVELQIGAIRSEFSAIDWDDCTAGSTSTCNKRIISNQRGITTLISVQFKYNQLISIQIVTNSDINKVTLSRQIASYTEQYRLIESDKNIYSNGVIELSQSVLPDTTAIFSARLLKFF
jgi:hypothetical protein